MSIKATSRQSLRERNRQLARDTVLDAAERLLQKGETVNFSMRALAVEAGVSFVTPFNHFGSKNAIMQALSSRLIERMETRFREEVPGGDAIDRVQAMARISIALLLEKAGVHKAVVGSLSVATTQPASVRQNSQQLWSLALVDFDGLSAELSRLSKAVLAGQLAFAFRGCLSFWIAGELADSDLATAFQTSAYSILLGFAAPKRRAYVLKQLKKLSLAGHPSEPLAIRNRRPTR